MDEYDDSALLSENRFQNEFLHMKRRATTTYQFYLDKITPFTVQRWAAFYVLVMIFMLRIFWTEGWFIICYTHAIYLLSLFLAFLTPKFDPSLEQELNNESLEEGTSTLDEDEFRPFIRRLPEFKFWHKATVATIFALFCSFIPFLDIPVFWPILLIYFIVLFTLTMKKQISHMVKYKYFPWDLGKKKYGRN